MDAANRYVPFLVMYCCCKFLIVRLFVQFRSFLQVLFSSEVDTIVDLADNVPFNSLVTTIQRMDVSSEVHEKCSCFSSAVDLTAHRRLPKQKKPGNENVLPDKRSKFPSTSTVVL